MESESGSTKRGETKTKGEASEVALSGAINSHSSSYRSRVATSYNQPRHRRGRCRRCCRTEVLG